MSGDPFYSSKAWRECRARYLALHPICEIAGCHHRAHAVDHIQRRSDGGAEYDSENLRALCASHHNRKSRVHDQRKQTGLWKDFAHGSRLDGLPNDPDHHWFSP